VCESHMIWLGRGQPAAKPKAHAKKVLKDDREVGDVVMRLLGEEGSGHSPHVLENYDMYGLL
jgi:hypothetical protein